MKKLYRICYRVDEKTLAKRAEILAFIEEETGRKITPSHLHQALWRLIISDPECNSKLRIKLIEYFDKY